jgi:hypothetical protein
MLNEVKHLAFSTCYEVEILRLRLRMTYDTVSSRGMKEGVGTIGTFGTIGTVNFRKPENHFRRRRISLRLRLRSLRKARSSLLCVKLLRNPGLTQKGMSSSTGGVPDPPMSSDPAESISVATRVPPPPPKKRIRWATISVT